MADNDCDAEKPPGQKPCSKCGRLARLVARGLCRLCYDRARREAGIAVKVANDEQLSEQERAVVRAAFAHRREHGDDPCLLDLVNRLPAMEASAVARAAFGAIRRGAASFRFRPIMPKPTQTPTCNEETDHRNHSEIGSK